MTTLYERRLTRAASSSLQMIISCKRSLPRCARAEARRLLFAGCAILINAAEAVIAPSPAAAFVCGGSADGSGPQNGGGSTVHEGGTGGGVACGSGNKVDPDFGDAVAFGAGNTASAGHPDRGSAVAFGMSNTASGNFNSAVAFGLGNIATGSYSAAFGLINSAKPDGSVAFGSLNIASGTQSFAAGYRSTASRPSSVALGSSAQATADNSVALGRDANAAGSQSIAIGREASSFNSANSTGAVGAVAIGHLALSSGNYSAAHGFRSTASGALSAAFGRESTASGQNSAAYGYLSNASGVTSLALGYGSTASRTNSVALGSRSVADAGNTVSVGSAGKERRITNVAPAKGSTDAVNLGQVRALIRAEADPRISAIQLLPKSIATSVHEGAASPSRRDHRLARGGEEIEPLTRRQRDDERAGTSRANASIDEDELEPSTIVGWANAKNDGSLAASRNILKTGRHGTGEYEIVFKLASLRHCTFSATMSGVGFVSVKPGSLSNSVRVETRNNQGALSDAAFYVMGVC